MRTVAIIGGGISGLICIKCCLDEGLLPTCYEMTNDIGGLWNYDQSSVNGKASVMKSTVINTSKEFMAFSDFPPPIEYPNFMHNTKLLSYFRMYATKFKLTEYIQFRRQVTRIERADDYEQTGCWLIYSINSNKSEVEGTKEDEKCERYDAVMLATGHHAHPRWADFPGLEHFKGRKLHSWEYKTPHGFEDKTVLIVGIGNSGGDMVVELGRFAKQVYLSTRRGTWVMNRVGPSGWPMDMYATSSIAAAIQKYCPWLVDKILERTMSQRFDHGLYKLKPNHRPLQQHPFMNDDLANRILCGSVIIKPNIKEFTADGHGVIFTDGSKLDHVDCILMATGFNIAFPYLDEKVLAVHDNRVRLYEYVWPSHMTHSTLAVMGLIQPWGAINPLTELQARWATKVFKGELKLPSRSKMDEDIDEKIRQMTERYVSSPRHTVQVDYMDYCDELADYIGCRPNILKFLKTDFKLGWQLLYGSFTPYRYRLEGSNNWDGARQAILAQNERVKYPLCATHNDGNKQKMNFGGIVIMMRYYIGLQFILLSIIVPKSYGLFSPITPYMNYTYSVEISSVSADLWWSIDTNKSEITFELHMNTTGWIAMGISPAGGMTGADIGVGWVNGSGSVTLQDRFAYTYAQPVIDNTTSDWFALQGKEENGWTAIQFKRLIDTCDSMDVPIESGTNILIFAWGLQDPDINNTITYHETRRGSLIIPLLSYTKPPDKSKFANLSSFDFRVNNNTIPSNESSYYCQVFKIPNNITEKRHVIAREILIDSSASPYVHHLTLCECDATAVFNDDNLPQGNCDDNVTAYSLCTFNIIMAWATGGDYLVEYPEEAGLPVGQNFSIKYYMIQIHYYNVETKPNNVDNSGIRLYLANSLRPNDLGGLTFALQSSPLSIAIPPNVDSFPIDSFCPAEASLNNFPSTGGLTVISSFPHTHLQGTSVWTKVIRNKTAVQYLFNAESYDANYQFEHILPQPIKIYPGDEFATRCVYSTTNKSVITLGGRRIDQEMCIHLFTYYPRMTNLQSCASIINPSSWQNITNISATSFNETTLSQWLLNATWTANSTAAWQDFYNTAPRLTAFGRAGFYNITSILNVTSYTDLNMST
ncbi:hypothetical protein I4U23_029335, partial [Adineta vaga]